jgi:hypothetical protein
VATSVLPGPGPEVYPAVRKAVIAAAKARAASR